MKNMGTSRQNAAAEHARYSKENKRLINESNKAIDKINERLEREGRSDEKLERLKYDPNS